MSKPNQTRARCCPIVELRQYTLHPGARDTLIELFEREFIESQEAIGMRVIGTFRDLGNPDRFIWMRGFQEMESRAAQLQEFYGGPVWKNHREAANATMIDSDNVLLLRPATAASGFDLTNAIHPPLGTAHNATALIVATLYHLKGGAEDNFAEFFTKEIGPILTARGIPIVATLLSEHHPNTFPGLPVREDANVFIWFTSAANREAYEAMPLDQLAAKLAGRIDGEPEVLFLAPTARSLLRGKEMLRS